MLKRINLEIRALDSLQKVKYFEETRSRNSKTNGQIVFMQDQNTQLLHQDILNLYSRKQSLENEIDLHGDIVTILSDFYPPIFRINGILFYARKNVPVFLMLTLIILIIIANKQKLREIFNKY